MAVPSASFTLDSRDVAAALKRLGGPKMNRAFARAVNRSAGSAKTAMVKAVREDLGLRAKDVRDGIVLAKARPGAARIAAELRVSRKRIPLIVFGARQLKAGVKAKLRGGTGLIPGSFIATMKSGHKGVFKRKTYPGGPRLPIVELKGPSLAKVFVKNWPTGRRRYFEQLKKNLKSEIRFQASKSP